MEDKAFALSVYKRSPRLYKYLRAYFQLPSKRTLQTVLAKISLELGVNETILDLLKIQVNKLNEKEKICSISFDEIHLQKSLFYNQSKQKS